MNIIKDSVKLLDLTDEEYFGNALPGYISNSKMGLINPAQGGSPSKYMSGFDSKKSESLMIGSAVHALLLEEESYTLSTVTAPSGAAKAIIDMVHKLTTRPDNPLEFDEALTISIQVNNWYKGNPGEKRIENLVKSTKKYYEYLSGKHEEGEIILTPEQREIVVNCLNAVRGNKYAMQLLKPEDPDVVSYNEKVIIAEIVHNERVYKLKAKFDNFTIDWANKVVTLNDLKTTGYDIAGFIGYRGLVAEETLGSIVEMREKFIAGSFYKFHYYRQMYMYKQLLVEYIKTLIEERGESIEVFLFNTNMVTVETKSFKPKCIVFPVNDRMLKNGEKEFNYIFELIDYYTTHGFDLNIELSDYRDQFHTEPTESDLENLAIEASDIVLDGFTDSLDNYNF